MEALEILFFLNKIIDIGFRVSEKVARGEMTKAEAMAEVVKVATDAKTQNERFDQLTGRN